MDRRNFLKQVAWGIAGAGAAQLSARAQPSTAKQPNIIFIMADDLGYGHLGCYGQKHIQTPHIDKLAQEGMRFSQAYAGSSLCAPSRSVLMTGYHAGHTPVRGNSGGIALRRKDETVAEVLKEAGYRTGLFGKWGLGDARTTGTPNKKGFDEFFGYLHQKHAHFYYTDYLWHNEETYPLEGNQDGKRSQYSHDLILEKALEFIEAEKENPFFCFLSLTIPHHEWDVPQDSLDQYADKFPESPHQFRWRNGYATPKQPKANMAAMISRMDQGVGEVTQLLEKLGLREDTLLIFCSDNGADSYTLAAPKFFKANGDLQGYKGSLYEGGLRVPAIASWPGTIPQGSVSDHPWYFADCMPTFAEIAGNPRGPKKDIDGISFLPTLVGATKLARAQETHPYLYWETSGEALPRAIRMGDWKAVWPHKKGSVQLYNLRDDLGEKNDLAKKEPDLTAKLRAMMEENHHEAPPQIEPLAPDGRYYRY